MPLHLFLLLIIALPVSASPVYEGKVVGISDGDTITVLVGGRQQLKVRLAEIDAPEKSQAYSQRSKQSLSDLAFGKQVRVEQQDSDRYGRVVGRVYAGGLDVNAEQIRKGMAWVYRQYNIDRSLLVIESEAKSAKRGLWSERNTALEVPAWRQTSLETGLSISPTGHLFIQRIPSIKLRRQAYLWADEFLQGGQVLSDPVRSDEAR
jgi:endonuclease YncB( thermonuclease family)